MPNPMGGMGGPKPCMMGPHMGPRMMHGPNLNTMNGEQNSCYNCVIDKYDIFDVNMFKLLLQYMHNYLSVIFTQKIFYTGFIEDQGLSFKTKSIANPE